ncbi:MAG: hypothetical protein J6Y46_05030 [Prevotella sp.]|nr:hypothetical protein [Prevotella sp.]
MKQNIIFLLLISVCTLLTSCTTQDDVLTTHDTESYDLLLSVGSQNGMRMANDVVQTDPEAFRGLLGVLVIPFQTTGNIDITTDDEPLVGSSSGIQSNKVSGRNYYYIENCPLSRGTNHVLAYGQAAILSGKTAPSLNGKLETTLVNRIKPSDITFSLASIRDNDDAPEGALALASYLTEIANTETTTGKKWSTTTNELKDLYLDFIHADPEESGILPGSAAHVSAYVAALRAKLVTLKTHFDGISDEEGSAMCTAIMDKIDNATLSACLTNGYPSGAGSVGLPDGAAALRWTGSSFSVRTRTTTLDNINGIIRYTYPAELWYYVNSAIYTSIQDVAKSTYENQLWNDLLNNYYQGTRSSINADTKSVAIENPLQYGVGRIQMTLETITGELRDSKDQVVNYVSADKLPMTAVIIGGQHTVGFDFKPMGEQSDLDARFIYDAEVGTTGTVNTLVLQSYNNEKVPIILEFENKTENPFTGKDGIVYPNTKFYLIGEINPADGEGGDEKSANRVFTQDYTTVVTTKVNSLANAYSCLPDLLKPRLEIGVQVQTKWIQSTTTTVKL